MAISKFDPTLTIEALCNNPEGQYFERKSARIKPRDLAHHLSAFANADGGVIAIGIEDDGRISGLEATPDAENAFRKVASDFLDAYPDCSLEIIDYLDKHDGYKQIMLFHVRPSFDRIISTRDGKVFLRIGDSSRELRAQDVLRLEYNKGIRSFEEQIVQDATMDDLDEELIQSYVRLLDSDISTADELLKARGLIKYKDGRPLITVAGVLLFAKHPTQFLPSAKVRFLRYEGTDEGVGQALNVVKDVTIEKPLHILLTQVKSLLASQMREFQALDADGRFRKVPEYPEFAWLEGVVNAVTHRDYSVRGEYVRIKMFDDRIMFHSPGNLPNVVTVENIQNTRYSRNPLISRVLNDFGWVRELNEGVKRIYLDMERDFLDPPQFSEPENASVLLVLYNNVAMRSMRRIEEIRSLITPEKWRELDALEHQIVLKIANSEHCSMKELMRFTGKSRVTIQNRLKRMIPGIVLEKRSSINDPNKFYTLRR